jgi:hypothetical protein
MSTYLPPAPLPPKLERPKPWYRQKLVFPVALLIGGMILGAAGAASAKPKPVEVIKNVPGPERVVTKEVPRTPAACLEALDLSEQGFGLAAEAMGYMSDAMIAASTFDVAAIQKANADLDAVNPKLKELTMPMKAEAAECRAGAE